jgi:HSP20 family molecular chaperone IbpA
MTTDVQTPEVKQQEQGTEPTRNVPVYRPAVDIAENKDELLILADLPGAKSESIDINFEDGVLTVDAKVAPRDRAEARPMLREYGVGDYHRTFRVSEQIDSTKIHAEYVDGVLTVHLPRSQAATPRKIEVHAGA